MLRQLCAIGVAAALIPAWPAFAKPPEPPGKAKDRESPVVAITSPADGATVSGSVTISAEVTDNVGVASVAYTIDGGGSVAMAHIGGSTWQAAWDTTAAAAGMHSVSVSGADARGNVGTASVTVNVLNDVEPPQVTILSPGDGDTVSGTVVISAEVIDNVGVAAVTYAIDNSGGLAMTHAGGATWQASWDSATVTDGAHRISVAAADAEGNIGGSSVDVTVLNVTGPVWPHSLAAIGDSITRAVFADNTINGLGDGQPWHSWATGYDGGDVVLSHYERIAAQNPAFFANYNNAVSGARMDDFLAQANLTVLQNPDYILVFLGHNDLCRSSSAAIPSDASFEAWFRQGLDALLAGLPDKKIVVLEIIDVAQLWDCCSGDFGCRLAWWLYTPCEVVTAGSSTDRATVRARTIGFNNILRQVCAEKGVMFEDRIFEQTFVRSDVSEVDCFHPSARGQRKLAEGSYDDSRF
jgi:lysophospholipase L1-like esterase